MRRGVFQRAAALALAATCIATLAAGSAVGASSAQRGLHVVGNKLLDAKGRKVHFRGVNRSGTEYACIQGWGIFDGPNGAKSIRAIAAWHVNAVRIPLNEQCWLGINGVKAAYGGASYRKAIVRYVNLLHRHNMYAELSLMWAAPGTTKATYQPAAPDADHSPAFWSSLATTFKNDPNVVLAPWGEPVVDANCFLKGGCKVPFNSTVSYKAAGMQQAVTVMRQAGYKGPIAIPGISYANDLTQWLSHKPSDPLNQLVAEAHVYGEQHVRVELVPEREDGAGRRQGSADLRRDRAVVRRLRLRLGHDLEAPELGGRSQRGLRDLDVGHLEHLQLPDQGLQRNAAHGLRQVGEGVLRAEGREHARAAPLTHSKSRNPSSIT